MPICDITHYLPISTLPPPETDAAYYRKPILVLIVSYRINTWNKYLSLIRKLQREARLLCVTNVYDLNELVDDHADEIAGFVVTTGDILLADEYVPVYPRRPDPQHHTHPQNHTQTQPISEETIEGLPTRLATLLKHPSHAYSVVFAFEFPRAAAKDPTSFTAFMGGFFGVEWTIAGMSRQRVFLELRREVRGRLAGREYRRWFYIRGVFLGGVARGEKVLVGGRDGGIEFGEPERMNRWTLWHRRPWIETPDTDGGEWESESESEGGGGGEGEGDEAGYLGDDEDDEEGNGDGDEDEDEEKLLADCPVAIHEVKSRDETEDGGEELGGSYVAFVGHLEDSRSMASLILGICGVEADDSD